MTNPRSYVPLAVIGTIAAFVLTVALASAGTIPGTPRHDRLKGTTGADTIDGLAGRDRIRGLAGDDTLSGGPGRDRIFAGDGNDTVDGGAGRDLLVGGKGDDRQDGGAGNDRIFANLGVDESFGGDGNDDLWALARGDVSGAGDTTGDTLHGGNGNDRFHTRDGEADTIDCGPGRDVALLDTVDVLTDPGACEVVKRAAPRTRDSHPEDAQHDSEDHR